MTKLRSAAVLLSSLPQAQQTEILKSLPVERVQELTDSIAELGSINNDEKRRVLNEFRHQAGEHHFANDDSESQKLVRQDKPHRNVQENTQSIDEKREETSTSSSPEKPLAELLPIFEEVFEESNDRVEGGFDFLASVPLKMAARALKLEDPQTVAIVLSKLTPEVAADLITRFDIDWRMAIIRRLAKPIQLNRKNEAEIRYRLQQRLDLAPQLDGTKGGLFSIVQLLGKMESTTRQTLIDCLTVNDLSLAKKLSQQCIEFDDFSKLTDREVKQLLRVVDTSLLAPAFSRCKHLTRHKLLKNLATEVSTLVKNEINEFLPSTKTEVDNAQKTIMEKIFLMKNEGNLIELEPSVSNSGDKKAA